MKTLSKDPVKKLDFFSKDLKKKIKDGLIFSLKREAKEILNVANNFPSGAISLVERILSCNGHIVFTGMGKSGLIGRKLSSTFSSMGMPSIFLHPGEALHGDLGMVRKDDLIVVLSKSGSGEEFTRMIPLLKQQGNHTVLICCDQGALVNIVDSVIRLPFSREACELNLAPTSSSTLMLAFGDSLAIVSSSLRGFSRNDFARFHPGGSLGKSLLLKVGELANNIDPLPLIYPSTPFNEVLLAMTTGKRGIGIVVDYQGLPLGIVTDGDLRRACESGSEVFDRKAVDIMTPNPKTISPDIKALTALEIMEDNNITCLVLVANEKVAGVIHIHDIIKAGIRR